MQSNLFPLAHKQMGIKIIGSFTTPDGFAYTNVYLRITSLTAYSNKPTANFHIGATAYLSQEAYDSGKSGLQSSPVPMSISGTAPFSEIDTVMSLPYAYYYYAEWLKWKGFTVEDVLETGQSSYTPPDTLVFSPPEPVQLVLPTNETVTIPFLTPAPADGVSQQSSEPTQ